VNDRQVESWLQLRETLRQTTAAASEAGDAAEIRMLIKHPTVAGKQEQVSLHLSADQVRRLHALGWDVDVPPYLFESIQVTLNAEGSPMKAISMGLAETKKLIVMTYLTIDRLFRGSVGVEQLRGPVGIIHIGAKVADRGFMYIVFFLGMISVNLAVINFLPIPIVDGGLFLFLVYEKLKGRPPSIAFQNAATLVGLCLIGTLFIVTFYNDVLRLFN
jgi:regulator of sigma E protease